MVISALFFQMSIFLLSIFADLTKNNEGHSIHTSSAEKFVMSPVKHSMLEFSCPSHLSSISTNFMGIGTYLLAPAAAKRFCYIKSIWNSESDYLSSSFSLSLSPT